MILREALRQIRKDLQLSQQAIAKKIGVTQTYWSYLETGKRIHPSSDFLQRLQSLTGEQWKQVLDNFQGEQKKSKDEPQEIFQIQTSTPMILSSHQGETTVRRLDTKTPTEGFEVSISSASPIQVHVSGKKLIIYFD